MGGVGGVVLADLLAKLLAELQLRAGGVAGGVIGVVLAELLAELSERWRSWLPVRAAAPTRSRRSSAKWELHIIHTESAFT